jgi:hypothetical protein
MLNIAASAERAVRVMLELTLPFDAAVVATFHGATHRAVRGSLPSGF